jgi:hypothetical protein
MKSRFALLAMLALVAAPLAAQGGRGGGRGMSVDNLNTVYQLSKDQKTKTQSLLDDYNKNSASVQLYIQTQRQNAAEVSPDSTKKGADLLADFNTKFKALLTANQVKKFDSVQASRCVRTRANPTAC